jgi:hypothetical protein
MIDLSMYASRLEIILSQRPPNFARCRRIITEAEEAWNMEVGGLELSDAEKLDLPLASSGIPTRTANLLEKHELAIYVRDLVGTSFDQLAKHRMLTKKMVREVMEILGTGFCHRYGIGYVEEDDNAEPV